ncbi:hypothetical protein PCL1606_35620 [Pseudomonas chlororaphis]|uniref:Uncharacterized protein n=1 Tax=Pseudomonas chlororaphis TaxID=587753 RepID=A0A0D5Y0Y7_9PSED|nr:hypothetical protein PCL1606_35620 [Pseudomonas chlororaphis]
MAIPAAQGRWGCRFKALINAVGLIIHPVGSPHSGHLPLGQDASEYPTDRALAETGARLSGITHQKQRLS